MNLKVYFFLCGMLITHFNQTSQQKLSTDSKILKLFNQCSSIVFRSSMHEDKPRIGILVNDKYIYHFPALSPEQAHDLLSQLHLEASSSELLYELLRGTINNNWVRIAKSKKK